MTAAPIFTDAVPILFVRDVPAAAAFYRDKLGFEIDFLHGQPPFYGSVSRGGARLHLRFVHRTNFTELEVREESLILAMLEVANVDALFEELAARGVDFPQRLVTQSWGGRDFHVRDPDGNVISFVQLNAEAFDGTASELETDRRFQALVQASSSVLYRMNADWSEMRQLGSPAFLTNTEAPTTGWLEKYIPPSAQSAVRAAIDRAVSTRTVFELEHEVLRRDGTVGWTWSRAVPILDAAGNLIEWFGAADDVTERRHAEKELRRALTEKEILLKEVHHRVKNNLQLIQSLLRLQADAFPDPHVRGVVTDTANRVHVIADIHQLLYQSPDLANVDMKRFIDRLCASVGAIQARSPHFDIRVELLWLDLQRAVPLGLILNELISNALKHGLPDGRDGTIRVELGERGAGAIVRVHDDGRGLPDPVPENSLGLQLVRVLTEQLGGEVQFERANGTAVTVRFPLSAHAA